MTKPRIFGIEVAWSSQLRDTRSVTPILHLLDRVDRVRYIHEKVYTRTEFEFLLEKWPQQQYAAYRIGYLAGHGSPGCFRFPGGSTVSLEELGEQLAGRLEGKVVYFGACDVFRVRADRLQEFRAQTKARAVAGFRKPVEWFESAAFELLFLKALANRRRLDAVRRDLDRLVPGLRDTLGFEMLSGNS